MYKDRNESHNSMDISTDGRANAEVVKNSAQVIEDTDNKKQEENAEEINCSNEF